MPRCLGPPVGTALSPQELEEQASCKRRKGTPQEPGITEEPAYKTETKPREPPTISVELKYHVKTRSWKPMQVLKVQGSRTLELFRAITVLVFPTDTSKAKARAKTCKPGREREGDSEDMAPV